jgi:hypothetical protein
MNAKRIVRMSIAIVALFIPAGLARAQQGPIGPIGPVQGRQLPVPAGRSTDFAPSSSQMQGDTHTLASIETLGLGSIGALTSFLDPSFRFSQSGDKVTANRATGMSSLGMNLAFDRNWSRSRLSGFYHGAKVLRYPTIYPNSAANTTYQNLGIAEELQFDRWLFRVREDFLSSPETTFGGMTIGGLILPSGSGTLNSLQPLGGADTILTERTKRLQSTTSGEINYHLSRRSILTAAGAYSSLTFSNAGYIDTHSITGRAGYDYLLSPKNVIGVIYQYGRMDFKAASPRLRTDSIQIAFGRKLTGRLAFQLTGGPQQLNFGAGNHQLAWTLSDNLYYQTRRTQYSLAYSHSSAGGSGVFSGASNHTVSASVHHSLSQWWSVSTTTGYAFNQNLAPVSGIVNRFGTWYGTANLERSLGRHLHFSFNYGFQRQTSGVGACPVAGCGSTALRQTAGVTMEWHPLSTVPR